MVRHRAEEEQIAQHREGKVILDLAIEPIAAAEAIKHIAAVAIALVLVAAKGPADEVALFVLMEEQMDVEHEEAADEADTKAAAEAESVAARLELLHEETAEEPTNIV
jgi:hypothetical protein